MSDARQFYEYLATRFEQGEDRLALEDLLEQFRLHQLEHEETLMAIREGLADVEAGRVYSEQQVKDMLAVEFPYLRESS